jgi:hypothetical protein
MKLMFPIDNSFGFLKLLCTNKTIEVIKLLNHSRIDESLPMLHFSNFSTLYDFKDQSVGFIRQPKILRQVDLKTIRQSKILWIVL